MDPRGRELLQADGDGPCCMLHNGSLSSWPFEIPREDELEDCPLCGELYLEDHFIHDCAALWDVRVRWLDVGGRGIGDLQGLV